MIEPIHIIMIIATVIAVFFFILGYKVCDDNGENLVNGIFFALLIWSVIVVGAQLMFNEEKEDYVKSLKRQSHMRNTSKTEEIKVRSILGR